MFSFVCVLYILHSDNVCVFLFLFSIFHCLAFIRISLLLIRLLLFLCILLFCRTATNNVFICNIFFSHALCLFVRYITYKNQKVICFQSLKKNEFVFFFYRCLCFVWLLRKVVFLFLSCTHLYTSV
jgi:hypothetical protein